MITLKEQKFLEEVQPILAVRIAKQPELYSDKNIGVNKPNTDGDKPAWFN